MASTVQRAAPSRLPTPLSSKCENLDNKNSLKSVNLLVPFTTKMHGVCNNFNFVLQGSGEQAVPCRAILPHTWRGVPLSRRCILRDRDC